jgi:hypothetical protein
MKNEAVSKLAPNLEPTDAPVAPGTGGNIPLPEACTVSSGPGEIVDFPLPAGSGFKTFGFLPSADSSIALDLL